MTGPPPIKVDILAGQNTAIPELQRTGTTIAQVAAGATGGLSPIQKFSKALVLSESREGTMALRALRGGLTEFTASLTGTSGPLARVVEALGGLGIGGPLMLAVTGGVAAIAFAIRALGDDARDSAAANEKLFTSLGQHGKVLELRSQLADVDAQIRTQQAAEAAGVTSPTGEADLSGGDISGGRALIDLQTKRATIANQIALANKKFEDETDKLRESVAGGFNVREYKEEVADEEFRARRATGFGRQLPITPGALAGFAHIRGPRGGVRFAQQEGPGRGIEEFRQAGLQPGTGPKELSKEIGAGVAAALALAGGATRGGAAGIVTGVGGAASALATLPGLSALGPVGMIASGLGGLVSLFSSHKPKVVISAFEGQARDDIQKIRGDPATTQVIILGGAGQGMAYDLARLAARGIVPRFPGTR